MQELFRQISNYSVKHLKVLIVSFLHVLIVRIQKLLRISYRKEKTVVKVSFISSYSLCKIRVLQVKVVILNVRIIGIYLAEVGENILRLKNIRYTRSADHYYRIRRLELRHKLSIYAVRVILVFVLRVGNVVNFDLGFSVVVEVLRE